MLLKLLKKVFGTKDVESQIPEPVADFQIKSLWATFYYSKVLADTKNSNDIPLLDMNGNKLGPYLSRRDWCLAGIEGTTCIDGITYNYAGNKGRSQTTCSSKSTETVRWKRSPYKYGIGNKNNPLIPFVSIATDQSVIPYGSKVFIKEAVGVTYFLEGQEYVHDGYFRADDVGGAIKGNHIDVFIGNVVGGLAGAERVNPFKFIKSNSMSTFAAVVTK